MADWSKKKILVLGLGRSGISAAAYLAKRGAQVLLSENSPADNHKSALAEKLKALNVEVEFGGHSEKALQFADMVVVSPGISPHSDVICRLEEEGKKLICDVEIAAMDAAIPIVGITGTNGKSTTTALTSHILHCAGFKAPACGNFGVPILDELENQPDYLVAEISSYQLHYCQELAPQVAVWMNLTPDHIDWHGNLQNYIEAKQRLFANQKSNQYAVLNADDPIVREYAPSGQLFPFGLNGGAESTVQGAFLKDGFLMYRIDGKTNILCHQEDLKIIGRHNIENALAAVSVAAVLNIDAEIIVQGLKSFPGLEHRLEYVASIGGVKFYNDSKATNPNSTIKALEAFGQQKIVLIAGGKDKHTSLVELVQCVKDHASDVILLGEAKERFQRSFSEGGFENIHLAGKLEEALDFAVKLGRGPVVLSPACASFDMFKDFEERGRVFKNLVHARVEELASSR